MANLKSISSLAFVFSYGVCVSVVNASCATDADCDDGDLCNGVETCDVGTGECLAGTPPCEPYQTCDPDSAACTDPDPCVSWLGGTGTSFFHAWYCSNAWTFDDIELRDRGGRELISYSFEMIARETPEGASPIGTPYTVETALWTVADDGSCGPDAIIPDTQCTLDTGPAGPFVVQPAGTPPDIIHCGTPAMPLLPDNSGEAGRCEIDFFIGYRTTDLGAGFVVPSQEQAVGGLAADDEFGYGTYWLEGCDPSSGTPNGSFDPIYWADEPLFPPDFANARVCTEPIGTCCDPAGACQMTNENDCTALDGTWTVSTISDPVDCEGDADNDGIDGTCGDNCPDDNNPGQEDCDGDGVGDACEGDPDDQDADGDGVCNGADNCRATPNADQTDIDGDLVGDVCDFCPLDNPDDTDGDGVCDSNDVCPGFDDNADGDADGVVDCLDQCPGVDDRVFAPQCNGAIPTVSQWGLVILTLLLLVVGKVYFGCDRHPSVCHRR